MLMELSDIRARVNAAILLGDMDDYVRDVSFLLELIEALQVELAILNRLTKKQRAN
jgi:hypothetical protein